MEQKNYIKSILKLNGMTAKELALKMTEKTGKKYTQNSITLKINRDRISFTEATIIGEILGYELKFVKKG